LLSLPAALFLIVFFVGPLGLNLGRSFAEPGGAVGPGQYLRALGDGYYLGVLAHTAALGAAVTLASLLLGYPLAVAIARSRGRTKSALIFLVVTPLLINVVVRTFGWMVIFGQSGLMGTALKALGFHPIEITHSWTGIAITLVHVLLPFMVLSIASGLEGIDPLLEDAATTLGAAPWQGFRHVVLPLSREGVVTGTLLVFALTIGSFVTVMLMGSNATMVMPFLVYQQLDLASDWPFAAALGNILLVIVVAAMVLQLRFTGRRVAR
jgi:ABC-type spermidine/putrescine transport system permease subunit I